MQEEVIQGYRLSPQQRHLWLAQAAGARPFRAARALLVEGPLDARLLAGSLADVVRRHEILRTTFARLSGESVPVQVIGEEAAPASDFTQDLSGLAPEEREARLASLWEAAAREPFDFERGPLVHASLVKLSESEHVLMLGLPALCADAAALDVLARELFRSYEAGALTDEEDGPVQYVDLSEWQNELLEQDDTLRGRAYWRERAAAGPKGFRLPFELEPREGAGFAPETLSLTLCAEAYAKARTLAASLQTSTGVLLLACWQLLLARLSERADLSVGVAYDGRMFDELKGALGLFARFLPVGAGVPSEGPLSQLVARLEEATQAAFKRQEYFGYEEDEEASGVARFNAFAYEHKNEAARQTSGALAVSTLKEYVCTDRFKLKLACAEREGGLVTEFHFDASLFRAEDVELVARLFHRLVGNMLEAGEAADLAGLFAPDAEELARLGLAGDAGRAPRSEAIRRVPRAGALPLSFAQQRLWFLDQLEPGSAAYNVPAAARLTGRLDVPALERTLNEVVRRHESIRTTFAVDGDTPVQIVRPAAPAPLHVTDLSALREGEREAEAARLIGEEARRPFDLSTGPLLRASLLKMSEEEHVLLFTMHHIVSDGWSIGVLVREVSALYSAYINGEESPLAELPVQYADFAAWQRSWLTGEVLEEQLSYWRGHLGGELPTLELPTDRPRPAAQSYRGAKQSLAVSKQAADRLKALSLEEGSTLFMTLLAAFKTLLARHANQHDILVGTPVAGRSRVEIEGLIGFFVNTLVLRTDLSGDPTFRELVRRVRETTLGAYSHQDVPFEKLVEELQPERSLGSSPLINVTFALQNASEGELRLPGLTLSAMGASEGGARFDLILDMAETARGLGGTLKYQTDLFDAATVGALLERFTNLLEGAAANPDARLSELPLLTDAERRRTLVEWNETRADYEGPACLHQLFEAQAARTPEAVAVEFEGDALTYAELDARAESVARRLRNLGVGPESRVGLCCERSLERSVALLGILKAGGAYVPLEPTYPRERLGFIMADAGLRVLLAQKRVAASLPATGARVVLIDGDEGRLEAAPSTETPGVGADNAAYVIYTSGSTGEPKGVVISHRSIRNRLLWALDACPMGAEDRLLQKTPFSFDASVWELFAPLFSGTRLVMARPDGHRDSAYLVEAVGQSSVTVLQLVPSMLRIFLREPGVANCKSLRHVFCGGEELRPEDVELFYRLLPQARLHNLYGPTEVSIDATHWECEPDASGRAVAIGRPLSNVRLYILDAHLRPVPVGAPGELHVGGIGLARGYLNRPVLTAEKFVPDAFSNEPGARLYKTGDLARYRADGVVEYLGRIDQQVKLRGFRIELGEVEAVFRRHPSVKDAAVVARGEGAAESRLVAYVVGAKGETLPGADELRAYASERLPEYMVPSAFVFMDALPTTSGGKLDRRALPAPDAPETKQGDDFEPPRTPTEEVVAGVWAEVLGRAPGRKENFFELGGHSLLAMQVMSRVRKAFGVELRVRSLFEHPTLEAICAAVDEARGPQAETQATAAAKQAPLSFAQQRLWFLDQLEPGSAAYNVPSAVRLTGRLDVPALERTLTEVVRRHESLRTTFAVYEGTPVQLIQPAHARRLGLIDLTGIADAEAREREARRLAAEEARRPFDLSAGPLLRALLLKLSEEEHVLLFTMHHIVSDGWSMGVLVREVSTLYAAYSEGEESPLAALPLQYADYATRQREWLVGEVLEEQLSYWRARLGGELPALELPTDRPRPAAPTYAGGRQSINLPKNVADALRRLSLEEGSTLFMTLLAGFDALLARHTNQHDILVGTPVAGRTSEEVEGLIGFFVNTLVLRTDLNGDPTFRELVRRVRETTLGAYSHQDVPFEKLVEELRPERGAGGSPLFNVMFTFQNASEVDLRLPGLTLRPMGAEGETAKFDLSLDIFETPQGLGCVLKYQAELFDDATAARMLRRLALMLEGAAARPETRLSQLPLLTEEDRRFQLEEVNATDARYDAPSCIHQLFERQAALTPEAAAVVFRDRALTYAELNARADGLAAELARRGVGRGSRVPVLLDRSLELVVSLLAVMKTGAAFSPLDVNWPVERLRRVLEDLGNPFVLVNASTPQTEEQLGRALVVVDADVACEPSENLGARVSAQDPLYVIYTSGSTGEPKGVVVPHGGVANRLHWMTDFIGREAAAAALQTTRHVYDSAVWQLFWPLACGGRTVIPPPEVEMSADHLAGLISKHGVTIVDFVPSAFNVIVPTLSEDAGARAKFSTLRCVVLGGEEITASAAHAFKAQFPSTRVLNLYGPTEASIGCVCHEVRGDEGGRIPIGRPISNARILILDGERRLAPVGVAGEIYIAGACLGLGYLNDPAKTERAFVPNPFPEVGYGRMYKTGDAARWLASGEIEFLGRLDGQLKIRGFRIEPGEIEAHLTRLGGVRRAVVLVREDEPGEKRLVAYVVPREGATLDTEELRARLSKQLPYYMIPSGFVVLDELPETAGYKVDRKALLALTPPEPERRAEYVAPRTAVEAVIAGAWAEVLKAERVGVHENFFEMGGHSLLATQVVSRLRKVWDIELPLRSLFEEPTVAGLAGHVESSLQKGRAAVAPPVRPVERGGDLPLSLAQQRLWFIDQLEPGTAAYNLPAAIRLKGALSVEALERTLAEVVRRHESLRTTFAEVGGRPVQVVRATLPQPLKFVDLTNTADAAAREEEARRLASEEARQPFDLTTGPLLRATLLRLSEEEHVLLFTMHHIVSDGWSMGVLVREVSALYAAFAKGEESPLAELPVQYADYAAWQRSWLTDEVLEGQLTYWRGQLGGELPVLELPTDRPRPAAPTYAGGRSSVSIDKGVADALKALSLEEGSTLFMTLLAAFNALLARHARQHDVVVGTPVANRASEDIEGLIGFFVNTLVMRTDLSGDPTFRELMKRVRETSLGAYSHQDVPFEKLVEELRPERNLSRNPLFQVMFIHQSASEQTLELPGLSLSQFKTSAASAAQFDLTLIVAETADGLAAALEYQTDLFDAATAGRMLEHFRTLLEGVAATADARLSELPLLTEAERRKVVREWNDTRVDYAREGRLHRLVEEQVARTPEAVALVFEGESLTYGELNARANRLARFLRASGVGRGTRVGVCVERSFEMVVALLGVIKSGGAYVPLDPAYPRERLAYMLEDARVPVLLTQERLIESLPRQDAHTFRLDADWPLVEAFDGADLEDVTTPADLAYVIYTSGSTGKPKGAMNTHRAVCNRLLWMQEAYNLTTEDRVLQKTPFSFDVSVWEFFWPLLTGAALVVARPGGHQDSAYVADLIEAERVTTLHFVPSMLSVFVEEQGSRLLPSLRRVVCSGEALPFELQERFFATPTTAELHNLYGPTEAAVDVTFWECRRDADLRTVPIGRPIANTQIYMLDARLNPVPVGVGGELHIGGTNVGLGYLGRPGLTAEKFIPDPFSSEPGARMYKTGDLARFLEDGEIEYLGRLDHQVKVRGFRIELGEIESALARHASVRECAVLVKEEQGDKRIVAYVVPKQAGGSDAPALRAHLKGELPDYMVPSAFVTLAELPLTPNGKLDRRALLEATPAGPAAASSAYVAPRTSVEEVIAGVWAEVLRAERVGARDDFFELGGHSLLATRVASRLREVFNVALPLRRMFERPTVEALAAAVEEELRAGTGASVAPPITRAAREGELPLSFAQQRMWFLEQLEPGSATYNLSAAVRLEGRLDADALGRALSEVVRRHESLRTTFVSVEGRPSQVVREASDFALEFDDLTALAGQERESRARSLANEEAARPFDLAAGNLLRARLLRLGEEGHMLLLTMHHIVSDGWSMNVLVREVSALYEAFSKNEASPLAELPIQYADFAAWQRGWLKGEALEAEMDYWRSRLAGAPPLLELPTDRPRPAVKRYRGALESLTVPAPVADALRGLSREEGATLFMTLAAAFNALLRRYTNQEDISVGTPVANRNRVEIEGLIGFFVNTLVLRTNLAGDPTFRELLRAVKESALGAYTHQDVPFEKLVDELQPERNLSHSPLFQVMFTLHAAESNSTEAPTRGDASLRVTPVEGEGASAKFDLTLGVAETPSGLAATFEYDTDLFDAATVRRMLGHFSALLASAVEDPDARLSALALLGEEERGRLLVEFNSARCEYPRGRSVAELFEEQVRRAPNATAVVFGDRELTYLGLNTRANQLARHLRRLGVGPETAVGLCVEHGFEAVVGLLGILKAGGTYVPLDPAYPKERLAYMAEDAGLSVLLTQQRLAASLPDHAAKRVFIDCGWGRIADESEFDLAHVTTDDNLAYVIYTSGSTGRPKGVGVSHGEAAAHFASVSRAFGLTASDCVLEFASLNFDVSLEQILPTLLAGARLVVREPEVWSPEEFAAKARAYGLTVFNVPPAYWNQLLAEPTLEAGDVRLVIVGGDVLTPESVRAWRRSKLAGARLLNAYGPTETVITATVCDAGELNDDVARVPVGRPLANRAAYILDASGNLAPLGAAGELHLGGRGMARGYLGRPALTAERFVPDPFSAEPGARMYRTGDLARFLPDGRVEFLGRVDGQVKVRGFRIELGEIESVLQQHEGVRDCVVLAREDAPGQRRLVGYVVGGEAGAPDVAELRGHLRAKLPDYMVPAAWVTLEELPLTPNGKVDRRALPAPDARAQASAEFKAPRNEAEAALAEIWSQVLGVERVSVDDNFFHLGGDSILSIQIIARANQAGLRLTPKQLFQHQTVEELAAAASTVETAPARAEQGIVTGTAPLTPILRWFFEQGLVEPQHYNQSVILEVNRGVCHELLEEVVRRLASHHDALRLRFRRDGESWSQSFAGEEATVSFARVDFSRLADEEVADAVASSAEEFQRGLDLSGGPLASAALFDLGAERPARLLLVIHHLLVDGVSWRVLLEDLHAGYEQAARGEAIAFAPKTTSFKLWAERLEEYAQSEELRGELAYWLGEGREAVESLPVDFS